MTVSYPSSGAVTMESQPAGPRGADGAPPPTRPRERDVIVAFSEITTQAITDAKLEDLLCLVGKKLCHLLGVTRCSLYLRRSDGRFRGAAGYCEEAGDISEAVKRQESGIAGDNFSQEVISSKQPVVINDVLNDPRPHRRTMTHWNVRAMLGVPLIFDDKVIGLIFVDNRGLKHGYTPEDVNIAEMFARLSALFISQAMLNARLRLQAADIARRKNTLAYVADVHQKLTSAVLEGADISTVVKLLSELSAKPVVLYSADFQVLAWTAPEALKLTQPPIIAPQVRSIPSVRATLDELSVKRPSATVPAKLSVGLGRRHLMCRLMIEGKPSGYLGIVEVGRSIEPMDARIAEHGATVLSLQILSERRQIETEGQARDDYLSDLLRSSRDKEHLIRRGPQLGIDLSDPHVLVRFSVDDNPAQLSASAAQSLVTRTFNKILHIPEPPAVRLPGAVIVLVRLGSANEIAELDELCAKVAEVRSALATLLDPGATVISSVCHQASDFAHAHRELREVGSIARSFNWKGRVLTVDELGLFRVVVSSGRVKEAVHFAHAFVRSVRAYDDGTLLGTWRAFVTAEGRVQTAAKALAVHENTVRYRLGKIKEINQQDPTSLDSLLSARMSFQVLDLAGE